MIYFLCRYSKDDRFADKRFAIEFRRGKYYYYAPGVEDGKYFVTDQISQNTLSETLLFVDMAEIFNPDCHAKYTLIFSTPDPGGYDHFLRDSFGTKYTLPTWTEKELCFVNPNIVSWYDRFEKFGGVPGHVFAKDFSMQVLDNVVKEKGSSLLSTKFLKYGFRFIDSEVDYSIIHINPPRADDGKYIYSDVSIVYTFASDFIFRKLCEYYKECLLKEATALYNDDIHHACKTLGGASAANLFEKLCLWLAPVAGRTITCESLETNKDPMVVTIPKFEILPYNWKEEHNLLSGVLYQPTVSNMEFGNAFCVVLIDGVHVLIVFQFTVEEMHSVKANGLSVIYDAFTESVREKISRKMIIFVTPVDGILRTKQPPHTQSDEDVSLARNFEKWLYRHHLGP